VHQCLLLVERLASAGSTSRIASFDVPRGASRISVMIAPAQSDPVGGRKLIGVVRQRTMAVSPSGPPSLITSCTLLIEPRHNRYQETSFGRLNPVGKIHSMKSSRVQWVQPDGQTRRTLSIAALGSPYLLPSASGTGCSLG
jgi:hypothetical protein